LERLELEIESLGGEIKNTEEVIENKKATVAKLFIELQQKDRDNLLIIFLKNQSLAESVSEAQSITNLNLSLSESAEQLRGFQQDLIHKLSEEQSKKRRQEIEKLNLINRQEIVKDQKSVKSTVLTQTKNQEKVYEQQIAELDEKQTEISAVIEEIEHKLRETFDPSLVPLKRPGVLAFPVESPFITQLYGETEFAQRAYRTKTHTGVDFRAPLGTPIFAAYDGKIVAVDNNDQGTSRWKRYQYGLHVVIEHDNNLSTLYAHLSKATAKKGDIVKQGDLIGYSGNTGYSTAAHLHLTVYWAPSVQYKKIAPAAGLVPIGVTIDPMDYLPNINSISADAR
jgi:murein DD-endopeptidase MepM/ murein hydrolase activator NlpD